VDLDDPTLPDDVLWNMVASSYDLVRKALPKSVQASRSRSSTHKRDSQDGRTLIQPARQGG